jgi:lycopene beta-cyclase
LAALDLAIVGGGLHGGLIALALVERGARVALIERGERLGGEHTWCFHDDDVPAALRAVVAPLVVRRWPAQEVRFPGARRRLATGYACVTSARLDEVVRARLAAAGARIVVGHGARRIDADAVELDDGERIEARRVIDARGPDPTVPTDGGHQVFLGQEVALAAPHGLDAPILMDAEVDQRAGFAFVYVLPLADDRLLIEPTWFADRPALDAAAVRAAIAAYAAARGWRIAAVVREERGVLPMPWRGGPRPAPTWPLVVGARGGWTHPATGYSFPLAARLAEVLAADVVGGGGPALAALCAEVASQQRFARGLNRLAFRWFAPADRWRVMARFYRLPEPVIRRFYALASTPLDRARILLGRPPRGLSLRARLRGAA